MNGTSIFNYSELINNNALKEMAAGAHERDYRIVVNLDEDIPKRTAEVHLIEAGIIYNEVRVHGV